MNSGRFLGNLERRGVNETPTTWCNNNYTERSKRRWNLNFFFPPPLPAETDRDNLITIIYWFFFSSYLVIRGLVRKCTGTGTNETPPTPPSSATEEHLTRIIIVQVNLFRKRR